MPGTALMTEPGAERISTRQSIHREQKCDQNLAFSLLGECFFLRSDWRNIRFEYGVHIYGPYIHMLSGTAMISCKMIHTKSHIRKCVFFWKCVVFLNYSKWQGKWLCKYIAPCISGETSTYTAKRTGLVWRALCPRFRLSGQPCEVGVSVSHSS